MIVQALYKLQQAKGHLTVGDLRALAAQLDEPLYRLQEVSSFFPHFRSTPPPRIDVHVCRDMACHMNGSQDTVQLLKKLQDKLGETTVQVHEVSCLGRCDRPVAALINEQLFAGRPAEQLCQAIEQLAAGSAPAADSDTQWRYQDTQWQIDVYDGQPRYEAVREYLRNPDPQRVIKALETGGLLGMGGAGGRAYKKWNDVLVADGRQKYVVCNADESEPGTFKDRELLLRTPHLILEGMILAGLVVGAGRGYVYVRHEYPEQIAAVEAAIAAARRQGVCGYNLLNSGRSFELEVFVSPGGYICGEQSALIEAMEDRRAEPRNRPPQLQTNGLWDQPTLLNNVETFAWVPAIVLKEGGQWYADQGRPGCQGRRFLSISGDVAQPGVYEVPCGITLGELMDQHAGGMRDGNALKAVALSGPSGGFVPDQIPVAELGRRFVGTLPEGTRHVDARELVLDINAFRQMGLMLGAGIVVYDQTRDMVAEALANLAFYRNESCGKCVPCRIGSQKLVEIATSLHDRRFTKAEFDGQIALVRELAEAMVATSICGLGQVASNPLHALLTYFPQDIERYLKN